MGFVDFQRARRRPRAQGAISSTPAASSPAAGARRPACAPPRGRGRLVVRTSAPRAATIRATADGREMRSPRAQEGRRLDRGLARSPRGLARTFTLTLTPVDGEWVDRHVWILDRPGARRKRAPVRRTVTCAPACRATPRSGSPSRSPSPRCSSRLAPPRGRSRPPGRRCAQRGARPAPRPRAQRPGAARSAPTPRPAPARPWGRHRRGPLGRRGAALGRVRRSTCGGPRIIDATSYWLEARAMAAGHLAWPLDEPEASVLGRFLVRSDAVGDARWPGAARPCRGPLPPRATRPCSRWASSRARRLAVGPALAAALAIATYDLAARLAPEGPAPAGSAAPIRFVPLVAALFSVALRRAPLPHGRHHVARPRRAVLSRSPRASARRALDEAHAAAATGPLGPAVCAAALAGLAAGWLVGDAPAERASPSPRRCPSCSAGDRAGKRGRRPARGRAAAPLPAPRAARRGDGDRRPPRPRAARRPPARRHGRLGLVAGRLLRGLRWPRPAASATASAPASAASASTATSSVTTSRTATAFGCCRHDAAPPEAPPRGRAERRAARAPRARRRRDRLASAALARPRDRRARPDRRLRPLLLRRHHPGGGARFFADVLPVEHALAAMAALALAERAHGGARGAVAPRAGVALPGGAPARPRGGAPPRGLRRAGRLRSRRAPRSRGRPPMFDLAADRARGRLPRPRVRRHRSRLHPRLRSRPGGRRGAALPRRRPRPPRLGGARPPPAYRYRVADPGRWPASPRSRSRRSPSAPTAAQRGPHRGRVPVAAPRAGHGLRPARRRHVRVAAGASSR